MAASERGRDVDTGRRLTAFFVGRNVMKIDLKIFRRVVPCVIGASLLSTLAPMNIALPASDPPTLQSIMSQSIRSRLERLNPYLYKDRGIPRVDIVLIQPVNQISNSDQAWGNYTLPLVFMTYLEQLAKQRISKECSGAVGGSQFSRLHATVESKAERIEDCITRLAYVLLDRNIDTQALAWAKRLTGGVMGGLEKIPIWSRRSKALIE